jgi:hypothetical protein
MLHLLARLGLAGLLGLLLHAEPARAQDRLVLVAGAQSPVTSLSSSDVHKLFLGLTVAADDHRLRPLRNDSDDLMRRVFFQSVVSMSEAVYDRHMLALTLQQGRAALPVLQSTDAVFDALAADPTAISFAWAVDAEREPRIKILRVLWHR